MSKLAVTCISLLFIVLIFITINIFKYEKLDASISVNPTPKKKSESITPEMVLISEGTVEITQYSETKTFEIKSFYIGKYEVTNKEYSIYNPEHENPGDDLPVVNISWYDAVAYCNWLSEKVGLEKCQEGDITSFIDITKNGYRLPTSIEWEYACRAGTVTDYYWKNKIPNAYCWYSGNSEEELHKVGQKLPNLFNLYDMSGNAWEWSIYFGEFSKYFKGMDAALHGGGFSNNIANCKSSSMAIKSGHYEFPYVGFRIAKTAEN